MENPNLFDYATKELSQDAMICWLMKCAEYNSESDLNDLGRSFIQALLNHKQTAPQITLDDCDLEIEILQQEKKIDVLARINGMYILLIEDKKGGKPHNNQLESYKNSVLAGNTSFGDIGQCSLYPIYFETGNYSVHLEREVEDKSGYKIFDRRNVIDVLGAYTGNNPIVFDYLNHLKRIDQDSKSFISWQKDDDRGLWGRYAWQGLFRMLEEEKVSDSNSDPEWNDWGYVPNPSGGFWGFWWSKRNVSEGHAIYLQLEQEKLCFKVEVRDADKEKRQELKWKWNDLITGKSDSVVKPRVMRIGETMTVATLDHECGWLRFDENGKFDFERSIEVLKWAEKILSKAAG